MHMNRIGRASRGVAAIGAILMLAVGLVGLTPTAASAQTQGSVLNKDVNLHAGDSLDLGGRQLIMQTDGNLVYYNNLAVPRVVCWASGSNGPNRATAYVVYQSSDNNFVIYLSPNRTNPIWASGSRAGNNVDIERRSNGLYTFFIGFTAKSTC